jgi:hypothetical protein
MMMYKVNLNVFDASRNLGGNMLRHVVSRFYQVKPTTCHGYVSKEMPKNASNARYAVTLR